MRNYIDILEEIDSKLKNTEFENFRVEIEIPFRTFCSAIEICFTVKSKINDFEKKNKKIRSLIGNQIDEFNEYCKLNKI
ncbi:hypothetical protein [Flavobacterium dankookense]|uniref:Uncharacterized protein n=1 Tax=Flavobacterium dankookense TaxID=706186 RepID=A0A4V3CSC2_9FLAO|nr:hypothetical protein [Flavobacterium dankookense]TDP59932.1 hypothetical protein BC748_0902 [Flavobacterium dankookense]